MGNPRTGKRSFRIAGGLFIVCGGVATFMLFRQPPTAAKAAPGDSMTITGIVRDFRIEHPDFGVVPADGYGHFAGNVNRFLDTYGRPRLTGTGAAVLTQWRDAAGRNIAPHMFNQGNRVNWSHAGVALAGSINLTQGALIDSWDSSVGDYETSKSQDAVVATLATGQGDVRLSQDAQIMGDLLVAGDPSIVIDGDSVTGLTGTLVDGGTMPTVSAPEGMDPSMGDLTISGATTLTEDVHCDRLVINDASALTIDGHVRILVEGTLTMGQSTRVEIMPESSLTIYTNGAIHAVRQDTTINANTKNPSLVTFYHLTDAPFDISQSAQIYAKIIAPYARVSITQFADFYGTIFAAELDIDQSAAIHIDMAGFDVPQPPCGMTINDAAGSWGTPGLGGISSAESFYEWFRDIPGVNISKRKTLRLTRTADDMLEYATEAFYPIDGRLYGNEGGTRNMYFTFEIEADFTYEECAGQVFEIEADDDVWVFIDGQLAIDLGGMRAGASQIIELDRLPLEGGRTYSFHLFFAQRQGLDATLRIRTNIQLSANPMSIGVPSPFLAD